MILKSLIAVIGVVLLLVGCGTLVTFRRCDGLDAIERAALRLGTGAAVAPVLVILLFELFRLPSHVVTMGVGGAVGLVLLVRETRSRGETPSVSRSSALTVAGLTVGVFAATFAGASWYRGFGGLDPWQHALGAAWLVETGLLRQPFSDWPLVQYIDGYPPAFDMLLSWVCALSGSIQVPLKATSAMLAAVSVVSVYFLGRRVTGSGHGAVLASILYAVAPGALGRHVWGHSLAVVLIVTGLACIVELRTSRRLLPAAALCFGGALLAAPSQGAKGVALAALSVIVAWSCSPSWGRRATLAVAAAGTVAAVWFAPLLVRTGLEPSAIVTSMRHPDLRRARHGPAGEGGLSEPLAAAVRGSDHRRYGVDDWLFFRPHVRIQKWFGAKRINFIVPEGLGIPVLVLALSGLLFARPRTRDEKQAVPRRLLWAWLIFVVLGTAGASIGVSFFVWRFWLLLVPIASVVAAEGVLRLSTAEGRSRLRTVVGSVTVVLAITQLALAVVTDTAAGLWRFWSLNPSFVLVVGAGMVWTGRCMVRESKWPARLATVVVLLHIGIAASARLRAITVAVEPTVFRDPIEAGGYLSLAEVTRPGDAVYSLSDGDRCAAIVGLDRVCRPWDSAWHKLDQTLQEDACRVDGAGLASELRAMGVGFVVLDPSFREDVIASCQDPSRFRASIVSVLEVPGSGLVSSTPSADQPSDSRVVVVHIPQDRPSGGG